MILSFVKLSIFERKKRFDNANSIQSAYKFQQNYYYLSRNTLLNEMFKTAPENRTAT